MRAGGFHGIRRPVQFVKRAGPRKREPLDAAALYEYAVRSLGSKMRTVAEIKRLLRRRVEPDESGHAKVDAVVIRLKEHRYLDDTRYAADYTRMRTKMNALDAVAYNRT